MFTIVFITNDDISVIIWVKRVYEVQNILEFSISTFCLNVIMCSSRHGLHRLVTGQFYAGFQLQMSLFPVTSVKFWYISVPIQSIWPCFHPEKWFWNRYRYASSGTTTIQLSSDRTFADWILVWLFGEFFICDEAAFLSLMELILMCWFSDGSVWVYLSVLWMQLT